MGPSLTLLAVAVISACGGGEEADLNVASADAVREKPQGIARVSVQPAAQWVKIAGEGGSFTVGTLQKVRFGKGSKWVERTMSGAGKCTNGFFGIDPAYGVTKECDVLKASTAAPPIAQPEPAPPKIAPPLPPTPVPGPEHVFVAPIVITKGGTYSANWESLDPKVPAVTVSTAEPVIIENCRLRGKGHLVSALMQGTNITVRNCVGQGLNPNVVDTRTGRFVTVYKPATLTVERNTLLGTAGIYADGAGTAANGITVRYNRAQNIEGRLSDGAGGYLTTFVRMQFLQLNNVRATKNVEIAWNQVINEPGKSRVEDNINIYLSSGTPASPMRIHDNYVQGAYAADPATPSFSGGGIIVDGGTASLAEAAGYVQIYGNQVVGTTNYGVAIAAGHDIDVRENRVLSSGKLADGQPIAAANVGSYVANGYRVAATFFNNVVTANTIGWMNASGRLNNAWFPDCPGTDCQGNSFISGAITIEMEAAELASWKRKLLAADVSVGSTLEP